MDSEEPIQDHPDRPSDEMPRRPMMMVQLQKIDEALSCDLYDADDVMPLTDILTEMPNDYHHEETRIDASGQFEGTILGEYVGTVKSIHGYQHLYHRFIVCDELMAKFLWPRCLCTEGRAEDVELVSEVLQARTKGDVHGRDAKRWTSDCHRCVTCSSRRASNG